MKMKSLNLLAIALLAVFVCGGCNAGPPEPKEATVADALAAIASMTPSTEQASSESLGLHRPRPASGFVPANPDTRTPLQWAQAACQAATWSPDDPQKGWRCGTRVPKPLVPAASGGQIPILPVSWTVPAWFVNKSTGNNANDCTTALTACASKQEIWVHRWGMNGSGGGACPRLQQVTTIEQDVSDTDNTDPIYPCAMGEKGAYLAIKGGAVTTTAATFTRASVKNRTAGANSLLSGSFSAGTPAVGILVTNTTRANSRAWIYKSAGGANWTVTQPFGPQTLPAQATSAPAEVDTWATNDSVTLSSPIAINIPYATFTQTDPNVGFNNFLYIYNATIFDPAGTGNSVFEAHTNIQVVESSIQRFMVFSEGSSYNSGLLNTIVLGSMAGGSSVDNPSMVGGAIVAAFSSALDSPFMDGDVILGDNMAYYKAGGGFGCAYIDANINLHAPDTSVGSSFYNAGVGVLYGNAGKNLNLLNSAHVVNSSVAGTFVPIFTSPTLVTGVNINGGNTASSYCAGTWNAAITTTPAHLDAACGAAGFGGAAIRPGGASVANF